MIREGTERQAVNVSPSFRSLEMAGNCGNVVVGHTVTGTVGKHIHVPFWVESHPPKPFWVAETFL